ncbi:type II restriction endonuclease [Candidatus Ruminimicrobiellum ovillum]|uniref:type II restriction endonuclease n=1 Tax=Candidatus Ruminimicrobiellum ovillum TaxID=1947927 RepID=UPI00355A6230
MKRNFEEWLSKFCSSISDYKYYIDFNKVYENVNNLKIELNILNSLIGSKNIEQDFKNIVIKYPNVLKCVPILLAVRSCEIEVLDNGNLYKYKFDTMNYNIEQYATFMKETGLFDLLANHLINNLVDYVYGVETGLDSNGRKNRGGHLMENFVEEYLKQTNLTYYKEMYLNEIETKWNINLSNLSNNGKADKRFDFVVKTDNCIYGIETNFYSSSGSKLNETARSYKMLATEAKNIKNFYFVWFTDGLGWKSAKNNLEETFDVMEHIYNINDIKNGIMNRLFK